MSLAHLGWNSERERELAALGDPELIPGRVRAQHRGRVDVHTDAGVVPVTPTSHLHPAVGDWVALRGDRLQAILERRGVLERADPGGRSEPQTLCANVDVVLCCASLNRDYNVRRLERLIGIAAAADAEAVVLLTKADLVEDAGARALDTRAELGFAVPVLTVSASTGADLDALRPWIAPGRTAVLAGSSGVGKSTLVNALVGAEVLATGAIRDSDDRGRHVSVRRELVLVPDGGAIIDLPGLRLPRMLDPDGVERAFDDVATLEAACRFGDCSHTGEPGCAVVDAVERGELDPKRVKHREKLAREAARAAERTHERRARERKWSRISREVQNRPRDR